MFLRVLLLVALSFLAACDQRTQVNKAAQGEELELTKHLVELLQQRDLLAVGAQFEPEALQAAPGDALPALANLLPEDPPSAIEIEGVNVLRRADLTETSLVLEYAFAKKWVLVEIAIVRKPDIPLPMVRAIRITPLPASLREINAFQWTGKPIEAYLVAIATLMVIAFIGISLIVCLATTRLKWRWRLIWCCAMFTGAGHALVEWTNGQVELKLSELSFFSIGIGRLGPDGPYYFQAAVPICAIAFWLFRRMRNEPPRGAAMDQLAQFD